MTKTLEVTINGKTYTVQVGDTNASPVQVTVNGEARSVTWREAAAQAPAAPAAPSAPAPAPVVTPGPQPVAAPAAAPAPQAGAAITVNAPMPGKVLSVRVAVGDQVAEGATVCTLEAMKMEMPIAAPRGGRVTEVLAKVGTNVQYDDPLVVIA